MPIFLIPGLVCGAWSYTRLAVHLSKTFRCIGYDLPTGQGDGALLSRYRFGDLSADLIALMDHLQIKKAGIIASSFGSMIALAAASRWPDRWLAMILVGGFARRRLAPLEVALARLAMHWPGSLATLASLNRLLSPDFRVFLDSQPAGERHKVIDELGMLPLRALTKRVVWMHETNLVQLREIAVPVALVYGDRDSSRTLPGAIALGDELTNVSEFILPDCGSYAILTHQDLVAQVVQSRLLPLCSHAAND